MYWEPLDSDRTLSCDTDLDDQHNTPYHLRRYLRLPSGGAWLGPWRIERRPDGFMWIRYARRDDGRRLKRTIVIYGSRVGVG